MTTSNKPGGVKQIIEDWIYTYEKDKYSGDLMGVDGATERIELYMDEFALKFVEWLHSLSYEQKGKVDLMCGFKKKSITELLTEFKTNHYK